MILQIEGSNVRTGRQGGRGSRMSDGGCRMADACCQRCRVAVFSRKKFVPCLFENFSSSFGLVQTVLVESPWIVGRRRQRKNVKFRQMRETRCLNKNASR